MDRYGQSSLIGKLLLTYWFVNCAERKLPHMKFLRALLLSVAIAACTGTADQTDADSARSDSSPDGTTGAAAANDSATSTGARSRYTSLQDCELIESGGEDASYSLQHCQGPGAVLVRTTADARDNLAIQLRDGATYSLDLGRVSSGAFSTIGSTAEWRYTLDAEAGGMPSALIFRFDVFEDPESPDRPVSYLIVARVSASEACVIGVVPPVAGQNERARDIADAGGACLSADAPGS